MSIDLDHLLVETATPYSTSRNEYGDTAYSAGTPERALYRDISTLDELSNRNEVSIDGILWLDAGSPVQRGDVYYHSSEGFLEITKVTRAKTLVTNNTVQFIRCEVEKTRQLS